ncbi:hypothetical protein QVD17_18756 [Tagetes erecta]|uniref:BHLH domain-containing protein n=1 Tax=Tagetes erecta TaxID=13708 RepID=A0AAD8NVZ6_TARER|nr:hypothetical protein QVD17_18756 [Tagetes erecta]
MQMHQLYSSSQQQGLLQDLITPITHSWTSFYDQDTALLHTFCDNIFTKEDDSNFPNLSTFLPVNVLNSSSLEQQMYEYDDKSKSTLMVEQEDDKTFDNQNPCVFSDHEEKKTKSKKVAGQPSKNLMAERRRRKRLNDRLSMLRSIVPKISKMDRTSILADTIDYVKELMEKISTLNKQDTESNSNRLNLMGSLSEPIVNESKARNQPKFEVERRNMDTRIQIHCSTRPGLLLSTVSALEALGLDIQHCVISCFGDFTLQASCSEAPNHTMTSSEEMKQILIRNASCGGRSF